MPFDLSDPASTRTKHAESPIPADQSSAADEEKVDPLDMPEAIEEHHKVLDSYTRELDHQEANRRDQAKDDDCYDNVQWDPDDAQAVRDRGQVPIVFNVISTAVNWILGTEKRSRTDFHVLPRRKEDGKPAERKSQILKYLSDCNRTAFHKSRAFADAVKVGVGWLEDCYEEEDGGEPIVSRYESWRNMLYDSAGSALDLSDSRYVFRSKWVDYDIAYAIFPNRKGIIDMAARDAEPMSHSDGWYGDDAMDAAEIAMQENASSSRMPNRYSRRRVRIIEGWYRTPEHVDRLVGSMFGGELYDHRSPGHNYCIECGDAEVQKRQTLRMNVMLMTTAGLLWKGPSPYRHNKFPFTPIWGNRRAKTGLAYGLIRGLRDINADINKRASKAQFLMSVNRTFIESDAVDNHDETAEEVSRPDAYVVLKPGSLGRGAIKVENGRELADAELQIMAHDISMVQQASGVTDENQGRKTNATSGIAIERRQTQGALATAHYFDNLRFANQVQGEKQVSLIEQFVTEEKAFRITNMRGKPEYVTVNDGLPENDIVRSKADFVISDSDWHSTMREASAAELMDLMVKLAPANPQLVMVMLDLVIESTDVHNREELVSRIRQLTGMSDPDATEPSPEALAKQQAQAEEQKIVKDTAVANLEKIQSESAKNLATVDQIASAKVLNNIKSIGGTRGAIDIAADLMVVPKTAPIADEVLRDAGYVTRSEKEKLANSIPQTPPPGIGPPPGAMAGPGPGAPPPGMGAAPPPGVGAPQPEPAIIPAMPNRGAVT